MTNSKILELVKKEVIIEYWEQQGTKRRQCWLYYKHKEATGKQKYFYHEVIEYRKDQDIEDEINKRILKIAIEVEKKQNISHE